MELLNRRREMGANGPREESNTVALFHFDSAFNGRFIDACGNEWSNVGYVSPSIRTDVHKFGSGCLDLKNSQQKLTLDTNLQYQDFTIEAWFYSLGTKPSNYSWRNIFGVFGIPVTFSTAEYQSGSYYFRPTAPGTANIYAYPATYSWYHVAVTYDKERNAVDCYYNGRRVASSKVVAWDSDKKPTMTLFIGDGRSGASYTYLDEFRFSKGILYTGDTYVIPAAPFEI